MKTISLKIDNAIISETDRILAKNGKSRNRYISEAIDFYNKVQMRKLLADQLKKESKFVRANSLKILAEFDRF